MTVRVRVRVRMRVRVRARVRVRVRVRVRGSVRVYRGSSAWAMRSMLPLRAASLGSSLSTPVVAGDGPAW